MLFFRFWLTVVLLFAASALWAQAPAPRAIEVYSAWANSSFKGNEAAAFKANGWELDTIENTRIGELAAKLDQYDIVILTACYNLANTQDFGQYGRRWREFIENGGVLLVEDFEDQPKGGISWIRKIDERFLATPSGKPSEYGTQKPAWISGHPLMKGGPHFPGGVTVQELCWTYWRLVWPDYVPLVKDPAGRTALACQSYGKGLIVISTLYSGTAFPDANFIANLWAYAKDPERIAKDSAPRPKPWKDWPWISLPKLSKRPAMSTGWDAAPWDSVKELGGFKDVDGNPSEKPTLLKAGYYGTDLYLQFLCSGKPAAVPKLKRDDPMIQFGDCIEIHAQPRTKMPERRFVVNSLGAMLDEEESNPEWSGWWQATTRATADGWLALVRIPFSELKADGEGWGINFARFTPTQGDKLESRGWLFPTYPDSLEARVLAQLHSPTGDSVQTMLLTSAVEKPLNPGTNMLPVSIWEYGWAAMKGEVRAVPVDGEELPSGGPTVSLAAKAVGTRFQSQDIKLLVTLPAGKSTRFQLVFRNGEDVLASSNIYTATTLDYLDASLVRPNYRNLIQSKDKVKRVTVSCTARPPKSGKHTLRLTALVQGQPVASVERIVTKTGTYSHWLDASKWKPGVYEVSVSLEPYYGGILAEKTFQVQVAKPANFELTFGFNGAAYVNGKPFFPIGLYDISREQLDLINEASVKAGLPTQTMREMIASVKAQGFNLGVMGDGFPKDDMLQAADELGFYLLPSGALESREEIARRVAVANAHKCILAWYGVDEMSDAFDYVNRSMAAYKDWREIDPNRPVVSAVQNWNPSLVPRIKQALDILMPDNYPVPLYPMERAPDGVKIAADFMGNRAGLWIVPQAFAWPNERVQTWRETRWMAYSAIAQGAQGLIWYTYGAQGLKRTDNKRGCWFLPDYPELWTNFKTLNAEIETLKLPILEGKLRKDIKAPAGVYFRAFEHKSKLYLIAANGGKAIKDAKITGASGTFQVLGEGRSLKASGGTFKDDFEPYTAYVYVAK